MKDSEILIEARKLIRAKEQNRVCYAIEYAGHTSRNQVDKLTHWISRMLGEYTFYEDWLIAHHPEFAELKKITTMDHVNKLREGRIAWLTWMIEYCQAEEAKS